MIASFLGVIFPGGIQVRKTNELDIKGTAVRVVKINGVDFVCLTDMAKLRSEDPSFTINHWMRNRMTIEYLGLWETLYNPNFKPTEFEGFRNEGNQRDYATINQLICISNMENINTVMINDGIPQPQRLKKLNEIAIQQMRICEA